MQGGRVVYASFKTMTVVGTQRWDAILLVEYPSLRHTVEMATAMEEYRAIKHWRLEALSDFAFVALKPGWGPTKDVTNPFAAERPAADITKVKTWNGEKYMAEVTASGDPHMWPSTENMIGFLNNPSMAGRIWMLNLLRIKDPVEYSKYGAGVMPLVSSIGGGIGPLFKAAGPDAKH